MTRGLPVGLEIDRPVGSDAKLLNPRVIDRIRPGHDAAATALETSTRLTLRPAGQKLSSR
jgi:hypothetical protein